ncbi:MAG: hypothetical protein MJ188_12270, partial [Treponema sp.]|nr:hypothetical protein [Treponema sp.]
DAYIAELKKLNLHTVAEPAMKKAIEELKIVYTPLHGTGNVPVMRVLKELIQDMASVSVSNADINSQNIKVILTLCE